MSNVVNVLTHTADIKFSPLQQNEIEKLKKKYRAMDSKDHAGINESPLPRGTEVHKNHGEIGCTVSRNIVDILQEQDLVENESRPNILGNMEKQGSWFKAFKSRSKGSQ